MLLANPTIVGNDTGFLEQIQDKSDVEIVPPRGIPDRDRRAEGFGLRPETAFGLGGHLEQEILTVARGRLGFGRKRLAGPRLPENPPAVF